MLNLLPEGTNHGNPYREILSGVFVVDLTMFTDERGTLTELYRQSWFDTATLQWNYTFNKATVMRGAHAHLKRNEHIVFAHGTARIGLHDARPGSPTEGKAVMLDLSEKKLQLLYVPAGVVHCIYAPTDNIMLVGQSSYYERADEYDCNFNDPALGFSWAAVDHDQLIMTERDQQAGPLSALKKVVPEWHPATISIGSVPPQELSAG